MMLVDVKSVVTFRKQKTFHNTCSISLTPLCRYTETAHIDVPHLMCGKFRVKSEEVEAKVFAKLMTDLGSDCFRIH